MMPYKLPVLLLLMGDRRVADNLWRYWTEFTMKNLKNMFQAEVFSEMPQNSLVCICFHGNCTLSSNNWLTLLRLRNFCVILCMLTFLRSDVSFVKNSLLWSEWGLMLPLFVVCWRFRSNCTWTVKVWISVYSVVYTVWFTEPPKYISKSCFVMDA